MLFGLRYCKNSVAVCLKCGAKAKSGFTGSPAPPLVGVRMRFCCHAEARPCMRACTCMHERIISLKQQELFLCDAID